MSISFSMFINEVFSNIGFLVMIILLSVVTFLNGFSDAPNAIATCVSTRTIPPKKAMIMAAIFNFLGILFMSCVNASVARTIFHVVDFGTNSTFALIALSCALVSIVGWTFLAGRLGIPTSESHALIAAITGAGVALSGGFSVVSGHEWMKVISGIVLSIFMGFIVGFCFAKVIKKIFSNFDRRHTKKGFRVAQIFGGAFMAFMHGAQAGLKFIGVFVLGIFLYNKIDISTEFTIPFWLILYSSILMSLGTNIGGYRIIKTVGMKMSNLELYQGAICDIATGGCLLFSSLFGIPVSTSHTKSLVIMGVSASRRLSSINWNVVRNIVLAGVITFPCCGLVSFLLTKLLLLIF